MNVNMPYIDPMGNEFMLSRMWIGWSPRLRDYFFSMRRKHEAMQPLLGENLRMPMPTWASFMCL